MPRTTHVQSPGAKRAAEALLLCALLGCAACSSSGNDTSADAGCVSGNYPPDGSFQPLYECSPGYTSLPEWTVASQAFHDAWSLINVHALEKVYAPDVAVHHTPYPSSTGPQPVETGITFLHTLIPNLDCVLDDGVRDVVAVTDTEGLMVTKAVLYNVTGTYQGAPINWHGLSFTHTQLTGPTDPNILIAEEVSYDDNLSFVT